MSFRLSFRLAILLLTIFLLTQPRSALGQVNPLDRVGLTASTPATPAYSLRLLSSGYSGSAILVRRSSDAALQNIGFTATGDLDTALLKTFVGSGSGFVAKWYDQGGAAINAVQAASALQPRIVNAGVIDRMNGKPALYFGTANLATAAAVLFPNNVSMIGVARGTSSTPGSLVTKTGTAAGLNRNFPAPFDFGNPAGNFLVGDAANSSSLSTLTMNNSSPRSTVTADVDGSVFGFVVTGVSGTMSHFLNGALVNSGAVSTYADGGAPLCIGNRNDGAGSGNFYSPELILFGSALAPADRIAVESAQKTYYSLPCIVPAISTQPASALRCLGDSVSFTVGATGTDARYAWRRNGVELGVNSATLTLPAVAASDTGAYTCVVTNVCGQAVSAAATLSIPGVNYTPPKPVVYGVRSVCTGSATSLTATASDVSAFAWYSAATGGAAIAQGAVYNSPVLQNDVSYFAENLFCGVASPRQEVRLFVAALPTQASPSNGAAFPASICAGDTARLTATVDSAAGQRVYWYDAPTGGNVLGSGASGAPLAVTPATTSTYYAQSQAPVFTQTFGFTGSAQTFTVPEGVSSIQVDAQGAEAGFASGFGLPGRGGRVRATLKVQPGQVLTIYVGGAGPVSPSGYGRPSPGGYNGGGAVGALGASGGGATDIRVGGTSLYDRVLVAGGGGGSHFNIGSQPGRGGHGGGLVGESGTGGGAGGGTQTSGGGGTEAGTFGQGGSVPFPLSERGGGGGGWYGGGSTAWNGGAGGGSSYTHPALAQDVVHEQGVRTGNGVLTLTYTTQADCAGTTRVPVTVTVRTRPVVTAPADFYSCSNLPITFTASGADTYVWQPGNLTGASITVAPNTTTTYTVVGTLASSTCSAAAQTVVTIDALNVPAMGAICAGATTTLSASGADTYSWAPGGLTGSSVSVTPATTTTYTVTGTYGTGCQSTKTVTVTVNPVPVVSAGPDLVVTPGTRLTLRATSNGDTFAWSPLGSSVDSVRVLPALSTSYQVASSFSATGCSSSAIVNVMLSEIPIVSGTTSVCAGSATTLTATGTAPFTWHDAATGGSLLYTGAAFTTPLLDSSTTYWVSANGGPRIAVKLSVSSAVFSASPAAICAGGYSVLNVQNGAPVSWYDAPSGGNLLAFTPAGAGFGVSPTQTTTYYAQSNPIVQVDTFSFTNGAQSFTVPAGVTSLQVDLRGGRGGDLGGFGGRVQATLNVTPGQVLALYVGGVGTSVGSSGGVGPTFNGGGAARADYSGSGGGGTDIRIGGTGLTDRALVAGGGGGGTYGAYTGGAGGGLVGGQAAPSAAYNQGVNGQPGTQTLPGTAGGGGSQPGSFGAGGDAIAGAGGGGWFGGGGGYYSIGAGAGGSSYSNPALTQNVVHTQGYNNGAGMIVISYEAACALPSRIPVTVTVTAPDPISITASADTVCTSVQLTASGGSTYNWGTPPRAVTAKLIAGLHQINGAYNGFALQLRRPSDNAVADFGFLNGELDLAAIVQFLGAETGRCVKLYDQSGNGAHLVQPDPSRQPLFISNGINGKPVLRVSASPARFMTSPIVVNAPYTAIYVAKQSGPARGRMLSTISNNWLLGWHGGNKRMAHFDGWVSPSGGIPADAQAYMYSATRSGSTSRVFENGVQLYANSNGAGGINGLQLNGYSGNAIELSDGDFGDILLFNSALSDEARAEAEGFSARYFGLATAISDATITVFPSGPATTYSVSAVSANGCVATASKMIVKDGQPPVIQCPGDQQIIVNAACSATLPDYRSLVIASDNCTPVNGLVVTQTPAAGTVINGMDTVQIQFSVRDSATYTATCSIRLLPKDTSTLRLVCPSGQTATQEVEFCGAHVSLTQPTPGNCRTVSIQQTAGPASGSLFPVGASLVTFTATDAAGNTAYCSNTITVLPLAYRISGDTLVCNGGTTALTLANTASGATVTWHTGAGGTGTLVATGNPVTNLGVGTYYARYQGPCTVVEVPVTVGVFNDSLTISGDSLLCPGSRAFLTATGFGVTGWLNLGLPVDAAPSSAKLALGLRLLSSTYTGPILRLRRASDDLQQDFGALGRDLDTAAISAWADGSATYCVTLYDQSGNGNHIAQATTSAQPQLLLHSAANYLPALRFGTAQFMQLDAQFPAPFTISYTARQTGGARERVLSTYRNNWLLGWHGGEQGKAYFNNGWVQQSGYAANNSIQVYTGTSTGSVSAVYENGLLIAANGGGTVGPDGLQLNGLGGSERSDCEFMEVVAFNSVLADTVQVVVEAGPLNYYVNRGRLLLSAPAPGATRSFTAVGTRASCQTSAYRSITVRSPVQGDPASFGDGLWKVHVWNSGGATINATTWSANYTGYYTATGLGFNSTSQWASGTAPSGAAGFAGCAIGPDNNSWSAKRKGFACSYYRLSVSYHDDAAQLWINGVKVWEHATCCDTHPNVWEGRLGATDSVEFRVTQGVGGSGGTLDIVDVGYPLTMSYAVSAAACVSDTVLAPMVNRTGGVFSATPSGLLIDPASGIITVPGSAVGNYIITYNWLSPCGDSLRTTAPFRIGGLLGDPAQYGDGVWNVYVFNSGGAVVDSNSWNLNYSGYYTVAGNSFNSTAQWPSGGSPSDAAGYLGCAVGADNHSWSAKRQGFTCGLYRIDITGHEDAAELWINGVKVWEHNGGGDQHSGVWTGYLRASDSVMFRATESTGGSFGSMNIVALSTAVTFNYNTSVVCSSAGLLTPSVDRSGGVFSAVPAGLSIDAVTGAVDPATSAGGQYTITNTITNGCGEVLTTTVSLSVAVAPGNPAVFGDGLWNVYAWNSGGATIPNANSWNLNYTGYLTATGLNFNTTDYWASTGRPSNAAGYSGCEVNQYQFSWSAKRKGFPCGRYQIAIPTHRYTGQLWINGVMIWEHRSAGDYHGNVWTGNLGATDSVEFRCLHSGSGFGSISFIPLDYSVDLSYPVANSCSASVPVAATVNYSGGVFSSQPAGLSLDTSTGTITPTSSSVGSYTIFYTWVSPCGDTLVDSAQLSIGTQQGDPSVYGADQWRVHVWNSGGASIAPNCWSTNYSGYYIAAGTNFSSLSQVSDGAAPSAAAGYVGCPVGTANNSWSAKRKGFPCGYYSINVDGHDDAGQLWINGIKIWEHDACCDAHMNVWEGMLGANDSVEFRVTQGGGGANGTISFHLANPTFSYPSTPYCTSAGLVSPSRQLAGGTFSASPAGLSVNPATGQVNTVTSLGGIYTVSYTYITGCGDTLLGTAPITITAPGGDPAVAGINAWNVYAWNAGDHNNPQQSWNTNYAGYIPGAQTSQPLTLLYVNGTYPSSHPAYQGCPITSSSFSYTAVRKGFTCGNYELRVTTLDGSGELWINGDLIRSFGRFEASSSVVWRGYLSSADTVEMRVRSVAGLGSRVRITLTAVTQTASLTYPVTTGCYVAGTNGTVVPATTGISTGTFSATPVGLALNSTTGAIDLASSLTGSYTITYSGTSLCGTALSASSAVTIVAASGDPLVYGAGVWNVYAYNAGTVSGTAWNSNYAGYYVASGLGFNTTNEWNLDGSPSSATGYQGCAVATDNHSWMAKRKGFPCGYYTIDVPDHDDDVELWINGVRVLRHTGYGDSHLAVWSGGLGPNDSIIFRGADGVGGSYGILTFTEHPTLTYSSWTGAIDHDWTNAGNWCGPVPMPTTDVVIPATYNQPVVYSAGSANVRNLTIQSGTSFTVQGTMNLYGNLLNIGGTLDMSAGRLDLEGSARQTVPAFTVQNLNINGGGGFSLAGNSTVSGTMNFGAAGGHVLLGSSDLTVANITGGDVSAFVVTDGAGSLKRTTLSGVQLMPVGVSTSSYTPLSITSPEGLDWSVRLQAVFTGYSSLNQMAALQRIWHITPSLTPTTSPVDLVFTYPDTLWVTPSLVSVFHYGASGGWQLANNTASGLTAVLANGLRSVALSGQQSFSPFAIAGTASPLPVTLLSFTGRREGSVNQLRWQTASEQNNRGFEVQRSANGVVYRPIGFVASNAAGGNSSSTLHYGLRDSAAVGQRHFYRLRQEDMDGHSRYSNIVVLTSDPVNGSLLVYPNPAANDVQVSWQATGAGAHSLILRDERGRTVITQRPEGQGPAHQAKLSLAGLASGTYLLEVRDDAGLLIGSQRIVKL